MAIEVVISSVNWNDSGPSPQDVYVQCMMVNDYTGPVQFSYNSSVEVKGAKSKEDAILQALAKVSALGDAIKAGAAEAMKEHPAGS